MAVREGKILVAKAFDQSFSEVERMSLGDYHYFTQEALAFCTNET